MKYLFYLGHPAHFYLFREIIKQLKKKYEIVIVIKKKDVLEQLMKSEDWFYYNLYPKDRKDSKWGILKSLLVRDYELLKIVKKEKPKLLIGTSAEITHVGKLTKVPSILVNEDDADQIITFAKMSYPFATNLLSPSVCNNLKWRDKTIFYNGYHELTYLTPKYFSPNKEVLSKLLKNKNERYFVLRLAKLTAHHDEGKKGINDKIGMKLISILENHGRIFISSERKLIPQFEKYRINLDPIYMHTLLCYADMYVGDSQTMAAEAAVLGIPSIRFNDFVGKLSYLDELENKYDLTYGITTNNEEKLYDKISELLHTPNLSELWIRKRNYMLKDKIDVVEFMVSLFENYLNDNN